MTARIDISGKKFGRWTVISYSGNRMWKCVCACGTQKNVDGGSIKAGKTNGCIKCNPGKGNRKTHGQSGSRLYKVWESMIARCYNLHNCAYDRYGARGIIVCEKWKYFETFYAWALSSGYQSHLTIDRWPNQKGNYEPENCRWATHAEQNRNYSRNRYINYNGRQVLACDLAEEFGLPQDVLKNRIFRYNWPIEKAISVPVRKKMRKT